MHNWILRNFIFINLAKNCTLRKWELFENFKKKNYVMGSAGRKSSATPHFKATPMGNPKMYEFQMFMNF